MTADVNLDEHIPPQIARLLGDHPSRRRLRALIGQLALDAKLFRHVVRKGMAKAVEDGKLSPFLKMPTAEAVHDAWVSDFLTNHANEAAEPLTL